MKIQNNKEWTRLLSISEDSMVYRNIIQFIKFSTRSTNIEILDIQKIPLQASSFEEKNKNKLMLEVLVDGSSSLIQNENSLSNILEKGFHINEMPIQLNAGFSPINPSNIENSDSIIIVCKVAIGRAYCIDKNSDIPRMGCLPEGFDSVRILNQVHPKLNFDDEIYTFSNSHIYYIYNSNQILPKFLVKCKFYNQSVPIGFPDKPLCSNCNKRDAEIYCKDEKLLLCKECDIEKHRRTEIPSHSQELKMHKRVGVSLMNENAIRCNIHPENNILFYCPICNETLCVLCKMNGKHSIGEYSLHTLDDINNAYKNAKTEASTSKNEKLNIKKNILLNYLSNLKSKMSEIIYKCKLVEESFLVKVQQILSDLNKECKNKLNLLLSDYYEILRQIEEINSSDEFPKMCIDTLSSIEFLKFWGEHKNFNNKILETNSRIVNFDFDIKLIGKLDIEANIKFYDSHFEDLMLKIENNSKDSEILNDNRVINSNEGRKEGNALWNSNIINNFNNHYKNNNGNACDTDNAGNKVISSQISKSKFPFSFSKSKLGSETQNHFKNSENRKLFENIEQLLNLIQKQMLENKKMISQESFLRSLYGKFFRTYTSIKNYKGSNSCLKVLPSIFKDSKILLGNEKFVLYMNLPLSDIWQPKTRLIFSYTSTGALSQNSPTIKDIFTEFQKTNNMTSNFMILKNEKEIFGGYASHPWSSELMRTGDENCFLFNITKNLRFETKGKNFLVQLCPSKNVLKFGETDLVLESDFSNCSSEVECNFTCRTDIYKDEISHTNVLAGKHIFKPDIIEIWCLE